MLEETKVIPPMAKSHTSKKNCVEIFNVENKLRTYVDDNNCKHNKMAKKDEHPIVPNTLPKMF
jgi:hypothetical protein